ncbi:DivIVA domain-containing protein [uncultured Microbacterium sp.]|uniref:DivIVA domain-containing protein n=1 Tax=uncultured Microbacterium sp. TaxID=191216 RepID=UPI0026121744|nr:DivIVA domain-containing protein [uncultured Microbacterium sp.]
MRSSDLLRVRLPATSLRTGYDADDVDDLLDRATSALDSWERGDPATDLRCEELLDHEHSASGTLLRSVRLRPGYAIDAVDQLLDDIRAQLLIYEAQGGDDSAS